MTSKPNYKRFIDLIRVVESVPEEKFDMTKYSANNAYISDCGCARHHFDIKTRFKTSYDESYYSAWARDCGVRLYESEYLFHWNYPEPRGNPAKLELLRRIREVLGLPKRPALEPKP